MKTAMLSKLQAH